MDEASFSTQPWGATNDIATPAYRASRVEFDSHGLTCVGNLFAPNTPAPHPAVVIVGPVAFVKEQAPLQYATRLAAMGFATLIFDPRHHGESEGSPRRHESPQAKIEDISAAIDFLSLRPEVDAGRISVVGVCQGVNWAIEAARVDTRIGVICLIAGHYLTPEVARMYLGGQPQVDARREKSLRAAKRFRETGEVDYASIVADSFATPQPDTLLAAPFIQSFYRHWADRHAMLSHRGLWENRITAMSEHAIWGHRIDESVADLRLPVLMLHADRAASGPNVPRQLFGAIPSTRKKLVWLGSQGQIQFYEDPITIDRVVPHIAEFLKTSAPDTPPALIDK